MEGEDFDIYGDLDGALIEPLQEEVNNRKAIEEEREQELKKIKEENENILTKLNRDNEQLKKNFLLLISTCTSEIKRKDLEIASLRKDRDDLIFRKTKQFNKKVSEKFTQTYSNICQSKSTQTSIAEQTIERKSYKERRKSPSADRNGRRRSRDDRFEIKYRDKSRDHRDRRSPDKYIERERRSSREKDKRKATIKCPERNKGKNERDNKLRSSEQKIPNNLNDLRNKLRDKRNDIRNDVKDERREDNRDKVIEKNPVAESAENRDKILVPSPQDLKKGLEEEIKELEPPSSETPEIESKEKATNADTSTALDEALLNFEKSNQEHFTDGFNEEVIKNHEIESPPQLTINENVVEEVLFDSQNLLDEQIKSTENESFDSTKENSMNNNSLNNSGRKRKIVTTEVESDGTVIFKIIRKKKRRKV